MGKGKEGSVARRQGKQGRDSNEVYETAAYKAVHFAWLSLEASNFAVGSAEGCMAAHTDAAEGR